MTFLGNVIWLVFGGLIAGFGYIIGGVVMCLTIVGIPFGVQNIKLGIATFAAGASPWRIWRRPHCWRSPSSAFPSRHSTSS